MRTLTLICESSAPGLATTESLSIEAGTPWCTTDYSDLSTIITFISQPNTIKEKERDQYSTHSICIMACLVEKPEMFFRILIINSTTSGGRHGVSPTKACRPGYCFYNVTLSDLSVTNVQICALLALCSFSWLVRVTTL